MKKAAAVSILSQTVSPQTQKMDYADSKIDRFALVNRYNPKLKKKRLADRIYKSFFLNGRGEMI